MFEWINKYLKKTIEIVEPKKMTVRGNWKSSTITKSEVQSLDYAIEQAFVKEWVSALQLGCPYCEEIQITSTALDVVHSPPDYWGCEFCEKLIGCLEGRDW